MHIRLTSHVTSWPAKRREEGADNVWLLLTGTECVHPPPPKYHRPPFHSSPLPTARRQRRWPTRMAEWGKVYANQSNPKVFLGTVSC